MREKLPAYEPDKISIEDLEMVGYDVLVTIPEKADEELERFKFMKYIHDGINQIIKPTKEEVDSN